MPFVAIVPVCLPPLQPVAVELRSLQRCPVSAEEALLDHVWHSPADDAAVSTAASTHGTLYVEPSARNLKVDVQSSGEIYNAPKLTHVFPASHNSVLLSTY